MLSLSSGEPELVVDGRGLDFIDHRGLMAMDRRAAANDTRMVLRSTSSVLVNVAGLLPLTALRVERAA